MDLIKRSSWIALFLAAGVVSRWIPHPPNFSAFMAIALFAGFVLPLPLAMIVPIAAVFLGDLLLGFHDLMWVVYLSLLPMILLGRVLPQMNAKPKTWLAWAGAGLLASIFFFLTTNFAVWMTSGMYPQTMQGLSECFVLALPFFHNSILATWIFIAAFEAVRRVQPSRFPIAA
jgi:hypothetical protein